MSALFKKKFVLGTSNFGMPYGSQKNNGMLSRDNISQIIDLMAVNDLNEIDTAEAYGDAEKILGEVGIQDFKVNTKFSLTKSDNLVNRVSSALERLKLNSLNTVLIHNAESLNEDELLIFYDQLLKLKKQGLISNFGVSIYNKDFLLGQHKKPKFDVMQSGVNIFNRSFLDHDVNNFSIATGAELHARSIFMQGILLMDRKIFLKHFSGRFINCYDAYANFLSASGMTPLEYCLSWILHQPLVKKIIIGVDSAEQLAEISSASAKSKPIYSDFSALNKLEEFQEFTNPLNW
jgi:aryl-alcohol dehydrogenase-like predicted oxidoreductase